LLAVLLVIACGQVRALDPSLQVSQYILDNWQTEEGLPEMAVEAIARTPDGYLWIGTQGGLARFDGVHFTVFDTDNEPGLGSDVIWSLLVDRTGRLWVGTGSGIAVLENGHFEPIKKSARLNYGVVYGLVEGKAGRIWVGAENGLFQINGAAARSFDVGELKDGPIRVLQEDRDGILWVGTNRGLIRFDGEHFESVPLGTGGLVVAVTAIHEDADGTLWTGSATGALYRRTGDHFELVAELPRLGLAIRVLTHDRDDNLWIGTIGGGLVRWHNGVFSALTGALVAATDIMALLEDNEGSLWICTRGAGLLRLREGKFVPVGEPEGLQGNVTLTIAARDGGGLWLGTEAGLSSYVDGQFHHVNGPFGYESNRVRAVLEDRRGVLWAGTQGAGVYRLDRKNLTVFNRQTGLSSDTVNALAVDPQDRIWVGSSGGLDVIDRGKIASMQHLLGMPGHDAVYLLYEDRAGNLWVGTSRDGLFVIGANGTRRIGVAEKLSTVIAIHEDERGEIWLGTLSGMALWRDGKLISLAHFGGPLKDIILQVLQDDARQLWFSTNKGLISVSRDALDALATGGTGVPEFHVYGVADGLRSAEFVGGNTSAGTRTPDGLLWFPSIRGIVKIDPRHIRMNPLPPPVQIERVSIDGAPLTLADGANIGPGAQQWEFHYTGLSLLVSQRSLFRYRLEGFDKDWIDAGNRRTAYYTRLPSGTYTFQVTASNNDGVWNNTGASFRFIVKPHFYQTWWFTLICAAVVLLLARAWYRWRVRQLRRLADNLSEQVADRTRDLELANQQMRQAQDTLVTTARQAGMAEIANNVLHNVGNVLNSVNVSAALIGSKLRDSKSAGLVKAVNLMNEHAADLGTFITLDDRGKALPGYLNKLASALAQEKQGITDELESLTKSVDHIKEIVATQQSYSGATSVSEPVQVKDLLEDALRMNAGSIAHHQIDIVKEFAEVPLVLLDKHLMLQILINLIGNAKHALNGSTQQPHQIKLKLEIAETTDTPRLRIRIEDNGEGIAPENLTRLFAHGFTTRKNGHGFGLHSCALAMKEMKGSITAFSDGLGRGAAFVVELPMNRVAEAA
jgi:ligand-binding sensor domain-containing protein/signal transduction histidine kinase